MTVSTTTKLYSGHIIPTIGLGVFQTPPNETTRVVKTGLKAGYRHFDSAQFYHNEQATSEGILQFLDENKDVKRSDIYYTAKLWNDGHGYEPAKASIKKSLAKLQGNGKDPKRTLGYIDLFLIHSPQSNREKRLGTWKALQEAVAEGTIKSIGVSNYGEHHIEEILQWEGLKIKPAVNQIELHPWLQRTELVEYSRKHGIALEVYSPLGRGQKLQDPQLLKYAKKYGKTPAQILIRWSLQAGFITLPKSVNEDRIKTNFDVLGFELSKEDFENLGDKNAYDVTAWDPTTYNY